MNTQINKYSFRTGQKIRTLIDSKNLEIDINNYTFSKDEKKLLFATETEKYTDTAQNPFTTSTT